MLPLYQINKDFQNCIEQAIDIDTGEVKDKELVEVLNNIKLALVEKAENIVYVIKQMDNRVDAIDKEIERLKKLKDIAVNTHESLKKYLANNLPKGEKLETDLMKISWRNSESVEITDISKLPHEYIKTKIEESPDKNKIKEAIKSGKEVSGAILKQNQNIQIR